VVTLTRSPYDMLNSLYRGHACYGKAANCLLTVTHVLAPTTTVMETGFEPVRLIFLGVSQHSEEDTRYDFHQALFLVLSLLTGYLPDLSYSRASS
jgi:hypothetical protein